jgi:hypothetical protein
MIQQRKWEPPCGSEWAAGLLPNRSSRSCLHSCVGRMLQHLWRWRMLCEHSCWESALTSALAVCKFPCVGFRKPKICHIALKLSFCKLRIKCKLTEITLTKESYACWKLRHSFFSLNRNWVLMSCAKTTFFDTVLPKNKWWVDIHWLGIKNILIVFYHL